jgi:hypothetical protein
MLARFLNYGVDAHIEWPRKETVISFGPAKIVAFPPSNEHDASLHIDVASADLNDQRGASLLSQLLTIAVWLDDQAAALTNGWSGNPVPVRPGRQTHSWPSSILDTWCNAWQPIESVKVRRALAIYREARNMEHFHSLPYAVLGYYKVLETTLDGLERGRLLNREAARFLEDDYLDSYKLRLMGFDAKPSPEQLANFLRVEGRLAVAHANKEPTVDPDDFEQQRKMSVAATILRDVARLYIRSELGVSENRWDHGLPPEK